jgi:hypothetical protein
MAETLVDLEPTPLPVERPRELLEGATSAHGLRAAQASVSGTTRMLDVWLFRDPPPQLYDPNPVPKGYVQPWTLVPSPGAAQVGIQTATLIATPTPHVRLILDGLPDPSRYRLEVDPPAGIEFDPLRTSLPVSLRPECPDLGSCFELAEPAPPPQPSPVHDYTARDWASLRRALVEFLLREDPDADLSLADPTVTLLELFAHVGDLLHYRLDRVATEAYLETARLRTSVRRHARLVDYRFSDGVSARTYVHLAVEPGTSHVDVLAGDVAADQSRSAAAFTLERPLVARPELCEIAVYDWAEPSCRLPKGATGCILVRPRPADGLGDGWLNPGDLLAFELVDPGDAAKHHAWTHREQTQQWPPAGAGSAFRVPLPGRPAQVVELTEVEPFEDPLAASMIGPTMVLTRVRWRDEDALTSSYPVSIDDSEGVAQVVVARGNVVAAHHGRLVDGAGTLEPRWPEGVDRDAEPPHEYALVLCGRPPGVGLSLRGDGLPYRLDVTVELPSQLSVVAPVVDTLLEAQPGDLATVVDVEEREPPLLRFWTGAVGTPPPAGSTVVAAYEVGVGTAGNVPANALRVLDRNAASAGATPSWSAVSGVVARNPVPATGGAEPTPIDAVRRDAPEAFVAEPRRAVLPADLAAAAAADTALVQRAAAASSWTGSWPLVTTRVDLVRENGADTFAELQSRVDAVRLVGTEVIVRAAIPIGLVLALHVCPVAGADPQLVREQALAALRPGTDDNPGVFHPSRLALGTAFYVSAAVAAVAELPLVEAVEVLEARRLDDPPKTLRTVIEFGGDEVGVLDDDPARPERGRLDVTVGGGG